MDKTKEREKLYSLEDIGLATPKFGLVFFNDDVTPMDYVVFVLHNIVKLDEDLSFQMMLFIHENGEAIVCYYVDKEEAEKVKEKILSCNNDNGMSLSVDIKEV